MSLYPRAVGSSERIDQHYPYFVKNKPVRWRHTGVRKEKRVTVPNLRITHSMSIQCMTLSRYPVEKGRPRFIGSSNMETLVEEPEVLGCGDGLCNL